LVREIEKNIPSEATFSRAFVEFAATKLPQKVHKALINKTYEENEAIILHNSRDSTAIIARERPVVDHKTSESSYENPSKKKRDRPKRGEEKVAKEPTRIERQAKMSLEDMIAELPKLCNIGTKKNSKGHSEHWIGYKLHLDVGDGCVPINAILTSASLHDSQVEQYLWLQ